jgi:hypothetical protein
VIRHRWRTHLKSATTAQAVVALVRDYLGVWDREEVASLPDEAWPTAIRNRSDIMSWMFRIGEIHGKFRGSAAALMRLQELLLFFTHAAVRVTQIAASREHPPANEDEATRSSECARPTASWRAQAGLKRRGGGR